MQYVDLIARLYPELCKEDGTGKKNSLSRTVTFQVTDACNLACTYCYQINKGTRRMSFETAKKFIDLLFSGENGFKEYVNPDISPALAVEFIGGEPFLEIELIDQICTYFYRKAIELESPWAERFMFSICSNGVLYRDPKVQKYLNKWKHNMSFSVTVDGNQELHDMCRVFHDGKPSYHLAADAAEDWMNRGYYMGSKITIAPDNVKYLFSALKHFIGTMGYEEVNCNCVYEEGWTYEHATELYKQLKMTADYLLENDLEEKVFISIFDEEFFRPKADSDNVNWCFRAGTIVEGALGPVPIEDLSIGDYVRTVGQYTQPIESIKTRIATDGMLLSADNMIDTFTTKDHPYLVNNHGNMSYVKVQDLKVGDLIGLRVPEPGTLQSPPNVAFLCGLYINIGHQEDSDFVFTCCSSESYYVITNILSELDLKYQVTTDTDEDRDYPIWRFYVYMNQPDSKYPYVLNILKLIGTNKRDFQIPYIIKEWDLDALKAFVRGLCHLTISDIYGVFNRTILNDILAILRTCGYDYQMYHLEDRFDDLGFAIGAISLMGDLLPSQFSEDGRILWVKVRNVQQVDEPYTVYNLTVANDHTFIANGAYVHNCGGTGTMLSVDPDGYLFPCIRYMESSLGSSREPYSIGHVDTGIAQTPEEAQRVKCLECITRKSQSTEECFHCPIANGCSWCSAYNYQVNGTADSRATYICIMHQARALANAYLWGKTYEKRNLERVHYMFIPEDWALKIIDEDEWKMLVDLPKVRYVTDPEIIEAMHNGFILERGTFD